MSYPGPDSYSPCTRCGKHISNRGIAMYQHNRWHERIEAKAKEIHAEMVKHPVTLPFDEKVQP